MKKRRLKKEQITFRHQYLDDDMYLRTEMISPTNDSAVVGTFSISFDDVNDILRVHSFYRNNISGLQGKGKTLFTKGIQEMLRLGHGNQKSTKITLQACCSYRVCEATNIIVKNMTDAKVSEFVQQWSKTWHYFIYSLKLQNLELNSDIAREELRSLAYNLIQNKKLVEYYNKTYGFEVVDEDDGTAVDMETTIAIVLQNIS